MKSFLTDDLNLRTDWFRWFVEQATGSLFRASLRVFEGYGKSVGPDRRFGDTFFRY